MVSVMAMTPVHLLHHGATLSVIGLTISLHVAGMYALSPVFGILADRAGRGVTILLGQGLLASSLLLAARSEEHTSELQSLMRISYAVFCLKKTQTRNNDTETDAQV